MKINKTEIKDITVVILAGGKGRRIYGCDKGLLMLKQKPIVEHLLGVLSQYAQHIIINANRNVAQYASYGYPVISDTLSDFQGPLAGIATALDYAKTSHILTLPCDAPLLPYDYVRKMTRACSAKQDTLRVAYDGKRLQPIYALIPVSLLDNLLAFLQLGGRKVSDWYEQHDITLVDFLSQPEMFYNINTEAQLKHFEDSH